MIYNDENSMNNDSFLPDLDDTRSSQSNNKSLLNRSKSASSNQDSIKKIFEVSMKYRILQENIVNQDTMDKLIQKDGFNFNNKGQLKSFEETSEDSTLDENQQLWLDKLSGDLDPLIPINPSFPSFFQLNSCNLKCYKYPFKSLKSETDFLFLDQSGFQEFFNQIPTQDEQTEVLNYLFLSTPWLSTCCQMFTSFDILTNILSNPNIDIWKLNGQLIFGYLESFGLKSGLFFQYFPFFFFYRKACSGKIKISIQENVTIAVDDLEILLEKLEQLIAFSLAKKGILYTEDELDFMFMLMVWLSMDRDHASFGMRTQTQLVFTKLVEAYEKKSLWSQAKSEFLTSNIYNMVKTEIEKTAKNTELSDKEKTKSANNFYHQIVQLIGYFKRSRNMNLKSFASELTLQCTNDILEIPNSDSKDVPYFHKLSSLNDQLKQTCSQLFEGSSYSMFILIEFLDTILGSFLINVKENVAEKCQIIDDFKLAVLEANRLNKDHHDHKGRAQVKVLIQNFLNKCKYYMFKLDGTSSKGCMNLLIPPSLSSQGDEQGRSQFSYYDESSIDMDPSLDN